MAWHFLFFLFFPLSVLAQVQVPPLQWINLSNLLQGSSPPPLRDAAMGYDKDTQTLIIFGGISSGLVPQSNTYLLNLENLTWSKPSPAATLVDYPPPSPRSAVISGGDFAASYRNAFIVIGGKDSQGHPLSDVWEYDFTSQFWSQVTITPGGPSARWGASGGIDMRTMFTQDPTLSQPNNSFYLAGGFNGTSIEPLSDIWRLNISGTLSSNNPNDVSGTWDHFSIGNISGQIYQAGTVTSVTSQTIVVSGGCNSTTDNDTSCATQASFVLDLQQKSYSSPTPCPAPRVGAVIVPNENSFSTAFGTQLFLLLGIFNTSLWQDNNSLVQGEVAILDTNTETWTRVLPSGDPDASGPNVPGPREGSSVLSFSEGLVGSSPNSYADTIVFGGQDANGTILSEMWLLRAYNGLVTSTNPTFGNGQLQSGINADGSGVRVTFITECASLLPTTSNHSVPTNPKGPTNPSGPTNSTGPPSSVSLYNTSFLHKLLSPLSLVLLFPILLFFRWINTTVGVELTPKRRVFVAIFVILAFGAYAVGVAGIVLSFTTISNMSSTQNHLKTTHGIAGLSFFVVFYGLVPFLYLASIFLHLDVPDQIQSSATTPNSIEINDKFDALPLRSSVHNTSPPSSPPPRSQSWDAINALRSSTDEGLSSDSTPSATTPPRVFEVVNRRNRSHKASGTWRMSDSIPESAQPLPTTRALGEIDWLLRRRAVHAVGELDYAITQAHNDAELSSSGFGNRAAHPLQRKKMVQYPKISVMVLHILLQVSMLGLSILTLVILWLRASRVLFAVFLIWLVFFYVVMIILAWNLHPTTSLLSASLQSLRDSISDKDSLANGNTPPTNGQGPYAYHRPPYRLSTHADEVSHGAPLSVETGGNDDDIDEDTRQRLIEEEMERRDVSIVTVPRRKLWITNPS